jgi:hypothetical protein
MEKSFVKSAIPIVSNMNFHSRDNSNSGFFSLNLLSNFELSTPNYRRFLNSVT